MLFFLLLTVCCSNQLKEAQAEAVAMSHSMNDRHKKIAENRSLLKELGGNFSVLPQALHTCTLFHPFLTFRDTAQ